MSYTNLLDIRDFDSEIGYIDMHPNITEAELNRLLSQMSFNDPDGKVAILYIGGVQAWQVVDKINRANIDVELAVDLNGNGKNYQPIPKSCMIIQSQVDNVLA